MIKTKDYNNLPEEILNRIPRFLKKRMVFEVLGIKHNKHAQRYDIPTKGISPKDLVVDEAGNTYQIAYITGTTPDGTPKFGEIWFDAMQGGQIVLSRNNAMDQNLYRFLMLSNYNESNEYRDEKTNPVFKVLNNAKEAKDELEINRTRLTAENRVFSLSNKDVMAFAAHLGKDTSLDVGVLRRDVLKYAKESPDAFLEADSIISQLSHFYVTARRALKAGILKIDGRSQAFKWSDGGKTGYKGFAAKGEEDNVRGFATWLKNDKLGNEVSTRIEAELAQKED